MSNPNQVYLPTYHVGSTSGVYGKEINMRQEFLNMLFGNAQEVPKAQHFILRRMQVDDKGNKIKCPCVDRVTQEPDKDYYCPICLSERYLFTESIIDCYFVESSGGFNGLKSKEVGLINAHFGTFYLPYNITISEDDKIFEINIDVEGNIVQPITRTASWQITDVMPLRSDLGKIEFIKVITRTEDVRYLNAPDR